MGESLEKYRPCLSSEHCSVIVRFALTVESLVSQLCPLLPNQLQVNETGSHGQGYNCRQYAENQQHTPLLFLVILTPLPYQAG